MILWSAYPLAHPHRTLAPQAQPKYSTSDSFRLNCKITLISSCIYICCLQVTVMYEMPEITVSNQSRSWAKLSPICRPQTDDRQTINNTQKELKGYTFQISANYKWVTSIVDGEVKYRYQNHGHRSRDRTVFRRSNVFWMPFDWHRCIDLRKSKKLYTESTTKNWTILPLDWQTTNHKIWIFRVGNILIWNVACAVGNHLVQIHDRLDISCTST